jgi:hypothetical protein
MKIHFLIAFLFLFSVTIMAQNGEKNKKLSVVESIESTSKITINQDENIDKILDDYINDAKSTDNSFVGGSYRVQVFSSNSQKTAKNESISLEAKLRNTFPEYRIYRIFSSPFWKVRIGDFNTLEDAQEFRNNLIKIYPELRKEAYTIREK